jgi:hypothetical protein
VYNEVFSDELEERLDESDSNDEDFVVDNGYVSYDEEADDDIENDDGEYVGGEHRGAHRGTQRNKEPRTRGQSKKHSILYQINPP